MFMVHMTTDDHGYMVYIGIYWFMVLYLLNHVIPMTFRNWDLQMFIHTMCRLVVSIDRMLLGTSGSARFFVAISADH